MNDSHMPSIIANFQQHQLAFTDWIRHGGSAREPNNISKARLNIYRELIFNNISSFIEQTYPITQALLPSEIWHNLIDLFFQYGQCDSPYYYDISLHFKDFLDQDTAKTPIQNAEASYHVFLPNIHHDYPWLRELMQYEWMELFVDMAEVTWLDDPSPEVMNVDLHQRTSQQFLLKTTSWVLGYQYPVHTWSTSMSLADIQLMPSCLLIFRDQNYTIQVHSLHPLWALFIDTLQSQEMVNFRSLTELIQQNTQLDQSVIDETLIHILTWLKKLTLLHIVPVN